MPPEGLPDDLTTAVVVLTVAKIPAGVRRLLDDLDYPGAVPLRLTLGLVLATRLVVLVMLRPGGGLIDSFGDFPFYRNLAELTLDRRPYLDFWVEYPPLFPWILGGLYRVALRLPGWPSATLPFQLVLGGSLLLCDVANVVLVRRIASRLHGPTLADRAALLYALQPFTLLAGFAWFDAFPLVFLLLAIDGALAGRAGVAGLALGLGGLAKLIPLVAGPAVVRALGTPRRVAGATAVGAALVAVALVPLAMSGSPYVSASLRATLVNRSSWETVWALAEGYWRVGTVAPVGERTVVGAADRLLHPAWLPWTLITGAQAVLFLGLLLAPASRARPRAVVGLAGLGLYLFLLLSRGYSPQFLLYQLPLLIALWPGRRGVGFALGLTALGLLEWPIVLALFPDRHEMIALVILARTGLWLAIVVELAAEVWPGLALASERARQVLGWLAVVGVVGTSMAALVLGAAHLGDRGEHAPVVNYLSAFGANGAPVFVSSRTAFYRLAPAVGADRTVLAVDSLDPSPDARIGRLRARAGLASGYWVVLDHSEGDDAWRGRLERDLAALGSRTTDRWLGYYHLLGFIRPAAWSGDARFRAIEATFGGQIALSGWLPTQTQLRANAPLRLLFAWRVIARPEHDYKLFLHVLNDATEQILAQDDRPLESAGRLAGAWSVGELPITGSDPVIPAAAYPAPTRIRIGLYDPATGARLPVGATDHVDLPAVFGWGARTSGLAAGG